ncbi:hypothetical protein LPTSP2_37540 [Leptospira ellinghausenii]|uniref:Uncharacterized protein n=1 Tax=Leptospira ellinghausenii TaxID=1917822 RepID=A0A2P2DIN3_9LEPT|nr:hypothetical protein [Leptospira ellinghausenii]GBF44451.1 hypothetical protein LPTSP2_37540 [Leptospira ellinghausenii]
MKEPKKRRVSVYFDIREIVRKLAISREDKEIYTLFLSDAYKHLRKEEKEYLHSKFIKHRLGNGYLEKIKFLEDNKIISRDNRYIVGRESKRFFISGMNKFSEKKVKMYVSEQTRISSKKKFIFSYFPEIEFNKKNLLRLSLRIDQYHQDFKRKILNFPKSAEFELYNKLVNSISLKNPRITKRNEGSRLFHFVTSLKKGMRYLLLADGEEVVEIDMSSAHFYFLILHLSKLKEFDGFAQKKELEQFKALVLNKKLYEFFLNETTIRNYTFPKTRGEIKKRLLSYLYLHPDEYKKVSKKGYKYIAHHVQGAFEEMRRHFPLIHRYITKISGRELQKHLVVYESKYMLRKFAEIVKRDCPHLFYVNIHDAILCKESEKDIVFEILNQIFSNEKPDFKVENIRDAFLELNEKVVLRKSRAKEIKVKKINTLRVQVVENKFIDTNFKITKEPRIGDTKNQTLAKIKKIKELKFNYGKILNAYKASILQTTFTSYRSFIGHGEFQIIINNV